MLLIPGKESSSSNPPKTTSATKTAKHIVKKGDTVCGIARHYNISTNNLIAANNLKEPYRIFPGQVLTIPGTPVPLARDGVPYPWPLRLTQPGIRETSTKATAAIPRYTKVVVKLCRAEASEPPAKVKMAAPGMMQTAVRST